MDLATRIRMELADGKSPDQVVAELTAAGMTEPTARRHVDRARSIPAAPTLLLEPPVESTGKWALIQGTFLICGTMCILLLAAQLGVTGQIRPRRYMLGVLGVVLFVRGLYQYSKVADRVPFPLAAVLMSAVSPFVMAGVFLATNARSQPTTVTEAAPAPVARPANLGKDIRSRDPEIRCRAAAEIASGEMMTYVTELSVMLMWDFDADAKKCARDAFARLLQSRDELKRLTTIHTLGHEAGGKLFDDLLRSAAEHDPSEQNRRTAQATLERRLQARKR